MRCFIACIEGVSLDLDVVQHGINETDKALIVETTNHRTWSIDHSKIIYWYTEHEPKPTLEERTHQDAKDLVLEDKRIHAIKLVRDNLQLGLKEAKQWVDKAFPKYHLRDLQNYQIEDLLKGSTTLKTLLPEVLPSDHDAMTDALAILSKHFPGSGVMVLIKQLRERTRTTCYETLHELATQWCTSTDDMNELQLQLCKDGWY